MNNATEDTQEMLTIISLLLLLRKFVFDFFQLNLIFNQQLKPKAVFPFIRCMLSKVVTMGMVNKTGKVEMKVGTYPEFSTRIFS